MVPTPVFLPGIFHGQKSLVGHSPWGRKELDDWATEQERTSPQSDEARFLNQVTGSLLWRRLIYKSGGLRTELPNPEHMAKVLTQSSKVSSRSWGGGAYLGCRKPCKPASQISPNFQKEPVTT